MVSPIPKYNAFMFRHSYKSECFNSARYHFVLADWIVATASMLKSLQRVCILDCRSPCGLHNHGLLSIPVIYFNYYGFPGSNWNIN